MVELSKKHKIYYKINKARASALLLYILAILILIASIWIYLNLIENIRIILSGIIICFLIILLTEIVGTRGSILYIESDGIKRERGILAKEYVSVNYEDVLRTTVKQSLIQRMFNYGDLSIDTSGMEKAELDFKNMPNPEKYKGVIDRMIDKANTMIKKK